MSANMEIDFFSAESYGKLALKKMAPVSENFRLYEAGWLGKRPEDWTVMKVTGAQFRAAKTGPNKGKLSIMIKDTQRHVHLTREEMQAFDDAEKQSAGPNKDEHVKPMATPTAKRGKDLTRTVRQVAHLDRLAESKGKRIVADLDAPAREAMEALLAGGYGANQVAVIRRALVEIAQHQPKNTT